MAKIFCIHAAHRSKMLGTSREKMQQTELQVTATAHSSASDLYFPDERAEEKQGARKPGVAELKQQFHGKSWIGGCPTLPMTSWFTVVKSDIQTAWPVAKSIIWISPQETEKKTNCGAWGRFLAPSQCHSASATMLERPPGRGWVIGAPATLGQNRFIVWPWCGKIISQMVFSHQWPSVSHQPYVA